MKPGGGKRKGASFERKMSERLSLWVSTGKRDDLFWRTAMSGGRATIKHKKGGSNVSQVGDICSIAHEGHALTDVFALECKHVKTLQIEGSLLQGVGKLAKFWKIHVGKTRKAGKCPILIAKQNRFAQALVLMHGRDVDKLFGLGNQPELLLTSHRLGGHIVNVYWFESFVQRPLVAQSHVTLALS